MISGNWETKDIFLHGYLLSPEKSQKIVNHSPDGFNWGYTGSGPSQLALALCLEITKDKNVALAIYKTARDLIIANIPQDNFSSRHLHEQIEHLAKWHINRGANDKPS